MERTHRKRKSNHYPYDYENTFDNYLKDLDRLFIEEMIKNKVGLHYATKSIKSGKIFEVEIYPVFKSKRDIPHPKVRVNPKVQNDLNERNSRKRFIRMVNTNFGNGDYWLTLTYMEGKLPKTEEEAKRNIKNYLRKVNRLRKKLALGNAKYIYIMEWDDDPGGIRCHYHLLMEGGIERNVLEDMWGFSIINDSSRIHPNEDGIAGLAAYMADKKRKKGKRRWIPSKNLKQPKESISHSQTGKRQVEKMARDYEEIRSFFEKEKKWEKYQFVDAEVRYNKFNSAFYIHIKARERTWSNEKENVTGVCAGNLYSDFDSGGKRERIGTGRSRMAGNGGRGGRGKTCESRRHSDSGKGRE